MEEKMRTWFRMSKWRCTWGKYRMSQWRYTWGKYTLLLLMNDKSTSGRLNLIKSLYGIIKFMWDQGSNVATFGDQGSKFRAKIWDQRWKNIPGYDPDLRFLRAGSMRYIVLCRYFDDNLPLKSTVTFFIKDMNVLLCNYICYRLSHINYFRRLQATRAPISSGSGCMHKAVSHLKIISIMICRFWSNYSINSNQ